MKKTNSNSMRARILMFKLSLSIAIWLAATNSMVVGQVVVHVGDVFPIPPNIDNSWNLNTNLEVGDLIFGAIEAYDVAINTNGFPVSIGSANGGGCVVLRTPILGSGHSSLSAGFLELSETGALLINDSSIVNAGDICNDGVINLDNGTLNASRFRFNFFTVGFESPTGLLVSGLGQLNLDQFQLTPSAGKALIQQGLDVNVAQPVTIAAGKTLVVDGSFSSASLLNNGTLVLITTTLDQEVTSPAGSQINVIGEVVFNGLVSGAGGIFGGGTAVFNGGYNPGDSPSVVNIENNITFGSSNALNIELGGLTPGQHDQLTVGNNATLSGDLTVSAINGFEPQLGNEFLILDIEGVASGQFNGLGEGDVVSNIGNSDLYISYQGGDGNDVVLTTIDPNTLLGDVNLDGVINLLDVAHFIDRLSTGTFQAEADCNEDGVINLLDVNFFITILSGG